MPRIINVEKNSIAEEMHIKVGDELIGFNNKPYQDALDFVFAESQKRIKVTIRSDDQLIDLIVKKSEDEPLGFDVEENFCIKECSNNCIFCFINQLPKGLRDTLYVKDDDFRMSFSNGNYVTLTNMTKEDEKRLIKLKLSPLYVSIHATDPIVRSSMIGNPEKFDIKKTIKRLSKKIEIHGQIVLCKHFNDGKVLEKTLTDVLPYVKTVAVVPVGLTKHRGKLPKLLPIDQATALETIGIINNFACECMQKYGERKVFASDELYLRAKIDLPSYEEYENFSQIENGIGLIKKLENEVEFVLKTAKNGRKGENNAKTVSIATGISAFEFMSSLAKKIEKVYNHITIQVFPIVNKFFGETVTVTGLLVGQDILSQLNGKKLGEKLILCENMLKENTELFLDGMSVNELEKLLKTKICIARNTGEGLVGAVLEK